ncbi:RNase H domain-containing protein [Raphanus sativus]|nr:RNase H domain-containing protein [Raphanus sativus]
MLLDDLGREHFSEGSKVEDLIDHNSRVWDKALVEETFSHKDAGIILKQKLDLDRPDAVVWSLTKNGRYSSKSGYDLLDSLEELASPSPPVPPIEQQLWQALWKTKTSPKLRHFLWRIRSGALAVKERLSTRGIHLNTTCPSCNDGTEDIGHVLFHCRFAQDVWALSSVPMPPSGSCGGAWVVRNDAGAVIFHSRRSFSNLETTLLADLISLQRAVEAMASLRVDNVFFETSSFVLQEAFHRRSLSPQINQLVSGILQSLNSLSNWRLEHVENGRNRVAGLIAQSVTSDLRFHSYVATGGPSWFHSLLAQEASTNFPQNLS